jgi:hypothetical protein
MEEERSIVFWLSKTPEQKLDALQVMREQSIALFKKEELYHESRKGLRGVYRITKQA